MCHRASRKQPIHGSHSLAIAASTCRMTSAWQWLVLWSPYSLMMLSFALTHRLTPSHWWYPCSRAGKGQLLLPSSRRPRRRAWLPCRTGSGVLQAWASGGSWCPRLAATRGRGAPTTGSIRPTCCGRPRWTPRSGAWSSWRTPASCPPPASTGASARRRPWARPCARCRRPRPRPSWSPASSCWARRRPSPWAWPSSAPWWRAATRCPSTSRSAASAGPSPGSGSCSSSPRPRRPSRPWSRATCTTPPGSWSGPSCRGCRASCTASSPPGAAPPRSAGPGSPPASRPPRSSCGPGGRSSCSCPAPSCTAGSPCRCRATTGRTCTTGSPCTTSSTSCTAGWRRACRRRTGQALHRAASSSQGSWWKYSRLEILPATWFC
mmetsp:Transcript_52711/g.153302  ORF Transcript_52711/g.153302 Transcript_52711/m.153302 type:complete len:378 (-) Transcript_52711:845-1978(-)